MTLPPMYSTGVPYLGPFDAIMVNGPVCVPASELHRYTRNPDKIVGYNPEDVDYALKTVTFAMVVFPGSTYLPDYPEKAAEIFEDNDYYNPPEYIPWAPNLN